MGESDWRDGAARTVMVFLNGAAIPEPDARGQRIIDDDFLVLYNAAPEDQPFVLPPEEWGDWWQSEVDTAPDELDPEWYQAGAEVVVQPRSLIVLRHPRDEGEIPEPPAVEPPRPTRAASTTATTGTSRARTSSSSRRK